MRLLLLALLTTPLFATVNCSATWNTGSKTCTGGSRPYTYTVSATTGTTGTNQDLADAYNDACLGDTIKLRAGDVWTFNSASWIMLNKSCGTGYLTITTTEDSKLPASGTRITLPYKPLLPIIQQRAGYPAIDIAGGVRAAEHIKLRGLHIRMDPTVATSTVNSYGVLSIGSAQSQWLGYQGANTFYTDTYTDTALSTSATAGDTVLNVTAGTGSYWTAGVKGYVNSPTDAFTVASSTANTVTIEAPGLASSHSSSATIDTFIDRDAFQPNDIVVQHCIIDNETYQINALRGMTVHTRTVEIRDNYIAGFTAQTNANGSDSQAILTINGPGPFTIENNFAHSHGENIMTGGSPPSYNVHPGKNGDTNYIRYNYLPKFPERDRVGPWSDIRDTSKFDGTGCVKKGRYVHAGAATTTAGSVVFFIAKNTGCVGTSEPNFASITTNGLTITDNEVTWERVGLGGRPLVKNNFETKATENLIFQYNVLAYFPPAYYYNVAQTTMINVKLAPQGCSATYITYPDCFAGKNTNIQILNNYAKNIAAGAIGVMGAQNAKGDDSGDYLIKDNLFVHTSEVPSGSGGFPSYHQFTIAGSYDAANGGSGKGILRDVRILNNTWYVPFTPVHHGWALENESTVVGGSWQSYTGNNQVRGNIWIRGSSTSSAFGYRSGYGNDGGNSLGLFPGNGSASPSTSLWDKNIILGSPSSVYPAGTIERNCPGGTATSAACGTSDYFTHATYGKMYKSRQTGIFKLRPTYTFGKRSMPDGSDIGADWDSLPRIDNLRTEYTDRMVTFRWQVSRPIAHIPCVIELNRSRDWEGTHAGELASISTYYGQDSSEHDRYPKSGNWRMVQVGHAVNLLPSTTYYYRLQCGGDSVNGSFTTLATLSGTATRTLSRVIRGASQSMVLQYGTSYSRATDTISGGGTASANCTQGQTCAPSFTATRGQTYYVRWYEKSATGGGGSTLLTGRVGVIAVQ